MLFTYFSMCKLLLWFNIIPHCVVRFARTLALCDYFSYLYEPQHFVITSTCISFWYLQFTYHSTLHILFCTTHTSLQCTYFCTLTNLSRMALDSSAKWWLGHIRGLGVFQRNCTFLCSCLLYDDFHLRWYIDTSLYVSLHFHAPF